MTKLTVVIPTRNEPGIGALLQRIKTTFRNDLPFVIIVDDSEGWETYHAVCAAGYPNDRWTIVTRNVKTGLLTATVEGILRAGTPYVAVMDGDGQHPPEILSDMVSLIESGNDYVGGSRFIKGGSLNGLAGWHRKVFSWTLRLLPRVLLDVPLTDPLTSFCMFRMKLVDREQLYRIARPGMWKIQTALLVSSPFERIAELPFEFGERFSGESKMSFKQGLRFFKELQILWEFKRSNS